MLLITTYYLSLSETMGMDRKGDHGGNGGRSLDRSLNIYLNIIPQEPVDISSPTQTLSRGALPTPFCAQIDLVPTLSLLIGLPFLQQSHVPESLEATVQKRVKCPRTCTHPGIMRRQANLTASGARFQSSKAKRPAGSSSPVHSLDTRDLFLTVRAIISRVHSEWIGGDHAEPCCGACTSSLAVGSLDHVPWRNGCCLGAALAPDTKTHYGVLPTRSSRAHRYLLAYGTGPLLDRHLCCALRGMYQNSCIHGLPRGAASAVRGRVLFRVRRRAAACAHPHAAWPPS